MSNIAIFASGSGSNAEKIMSYFAHNPQKGRVVALLSNKSDAYALERAKKWGVESSTFSAKELRESPEVVLNYLSSKGVDFIVLAGFMLLIPTALVRQYEGRLINIHPALLPKYGGKGMYGDNVHNAVIEAGEALSGITIHYVNEHYDEGAYIFQASVDITPQDTAQSLAQKIHALEHEHYPRIIGEVIGKVIGKAISETTKSIE